MINQLPRWIWFGGALLAFNGGWINTATLLRFNLNCANLTGNVTRSIAGAQLDRAHIIPLLLIIVSFVTGAVLSGVIIKRESLKLGRRYGMALILETLLLALAAIYQQHVVAVYCAALACGLQNAMVATYSGSVIRTTHLTGILSDIGAQIGAILMRRSWNKRQMQLHLTLVTGFVAGVASSAFIHHGLPQLLFLLPIFITTFCAIAYIGFIKPKPVKIG